MNPGAANHTLMVHASTVDEPDDTSASEELLPPIDEVRNRVIAVLSDAYAHDALDVDEFERRITLAHRQGGHDELASLIRDLAPPTAALVIAQAPASLRPTVERKRILAVLGSVERRGPWTPARHNRVVATLGNVVLDFREASLAAGAIEVEVRAVLGNVEIIVPPWLAVEMDGTAVLGNVEHAERSPSQPDATRPLLRIRGVAVFGNVEIHTWLPGESERDAHRRQRRERKALRAAPEAKKALPPYEGS